MRRLGASALCGLLLTMPARADGIDAIYPADTASGAQYRIGHFIPGVYQDIIVPALTPPERQALAAVRFDVPLSVPGAEPLAFWRTGQTVHLSASSMQFVADLMLAYVWLGRNGYQEASLDDYILMLSCWKRDTPPPTPRVALHVPPNARDDAGTDQLATVMTRNAFMFILLHELGHVLHDPAQTDPGAVNTPAMEAAADRFALDVLARLGQVPTGASALWQFDSIYESGCADPNQGRRNTHPLSRERMRQVARDLANNASRYARDMEPATLQGFQKLASLTELLADRMGDPAMAKDLRERAWLVTPADLTPRRTGQ